MTVVLLVWGSLLSWLYSLFPLTQLLSRFLSHSLPGNFSQIFVKKVQLTWFVSKNNPVLWSILSVMLCLGYNSCAGFSRWSWPGARVPAGCRGTWQEGKPWSHSGCSHASHYCSTDGPCALPPPRLLDAAKYTHIPPFLLPGSPKKNLKQQHCDFLLPCSHSFIHPFVHSPLS